MSSPRDYDMSDSSCSGASYLTNSPLHQVPQTVDSPPADKPYLRIIAQPQERFRFRYASELADTHGCLLSKAGHTKNIKDYPTVELANYNDRALIRCILAQHNNSEDHPHKLRDSEEKDVCQLVPEGGSCRVVFSGIGIVHTAQALVKKKSPTMSKRINFNIVRLKFSAHDVQTGTEICDPVFSDPIYNLRSPATSELKICRISRFSGSPSGGDDVFIFVEKVNKKHINIRFYELDESGKKKTWEDFGQFTPKDVHHQCAIAFRTPAYKDRKTPVDVTVYIELVRTTDGQTSKPVQFKYKAEEFYKQVKRRKICSTHTFDNTIENVPQMPVQFVTQTEEIPLPGFPDLYPTPVTEYQNCYSSLETNPSVLDPLWGSESNILQTNGLTIADLNLNCENYETLPAASNEGSWELASDYLKNFVELFPEYKMLEAGSQSAPLTLVSDSGRVRFESYDEPLQYQGNFEETLDGSKDQYKLDNKSYKYNAYYKAEDGTKVKKLVKELCDMIKDKNGFKKQEIRERLELLFEKRLSNGDTFLHMSLNSDPNCVYSIVKMIDIVKATYLLDYSNDKLQTPLHLAIFHDMPQIVYLLVSKGADPMLKDQREYNALHYAVKLGSCLLPLLEAIKKHNVPFNINEYNGEKQTALHMSAIEDCSRSTRLLLEHGASYSVRDDYGRTPLHLAAYDDSLEALKALLHFIPQSDIDVTDNSGNTALQIVCGGTIRKNSAMTTKLLLEKKADPMKTENGNNSAWHLVKNKLSLKAVLSDYVPAEFKDDCESDEDVFLSADEGENCDEETSN